MVDRDALPENLQGTYDDLNEFIEEWVMHTACIEHHKMEMERLSEEIKPRITLITDHLKEFAHLRVFGEYMDKLAEFKPDDKG
jgi:hypothetical protein